MKSTPIVKMEEISGIEPLQKRWERKTLTSYPKARCPDDHPTNERTKERGRGRLQRSSFVNQAKAIEKKLETQLPKTVERIEPFNFVPP